MAAGVVIAAGVVTILAAGTVVVFFPYGLHVGVLAIDDEDGVVVGKAPSLFEPDGARIFEGADERLGIEAVLVEDLGQLAQQRRQIDFVVLAEVLLDDFEGTPGADALQLLVLNGLASLRRRVGRSIPGIVR